jgi:glycerol-3-phosphate dehydrogenase
MQAGENHGAGDAVRSPPDSSMLKVYASRSELIADLRRCGRVDLVVIGGGIHGASVARLAAFNGLATVLFERDDYAFHTSSRSSKMIHGGLRYLESGDFRQVYEGLQARADWLQVAPHLVSWCEFLVPLFRGSPGYRVKLKAGLTLYDLLAGRRGRRHHWVPHRELPEESFGTLLNKMVGAYRYYDATMDDTRLTIESLVSARDEGARTLNYAPVTGIAALAGGGAIVTWRDSLTGTSYELPTGAVVNCAGPWAPWVGRAPGKPERGGVRYSRGAHLIFRKRWNREAVFLPLAQAGQYYWVWPHPAGTLVGTTDSETDTLEANPEPTPGEVDEILGRLERDLPSAGLTRETLQSAFCGVRTLPLNPSRGSVVTLSRRHRLDWEGPILTLRGGKFTTAPWTAAEVMKEVWLRAEPDRPFVPLGARPLPGAERFQEEAELFKAAARERGIPDSIIERVCRTWGGRVRFIREHPAWLELIGGAILRGEVALGVLVEQVTSAEDLFRRRLSMHYWGALSAELRQELEREVQLFSREASPRPAPLITTV